MKAIKTILAIIVTASFASQAADLSQAQAGYQHADRMASSTQASIGAVSYSNGKDGATPDAEHTAAAFSAARAQAAADLHSAEQAAAYSASSSTTTQQQNYGVKGNPNLTAQYSAPQAPPTYSGTSKRPGTVPQPSVPSTPVGTSLKNIALAKTAAAAQTPSNSSINVAVSSIPANTPVTATINGTVTTTTAGSLAKIDPQAQVAMPVNSAFSPAPRKGGHDHNTSSSSHGGTGNGSQNAANSRSGMAHGFGDNHVGGGSAQSGSRSVGKW